MQVQVIIQTESENLYATEPLEKAEIEGARAADKAG